MQTVCLVEFHHFYLQKLLEEEVEDVKVIMLQVLQVVLEVVVVFLNRMPLAVQVTTVVVVLLILQ